jgi:hypothetical protein
VNLSVSERQQRNDRQVLESKDRWLVIAKEICVQLPIAVPHPTGSGNKKTQKEFLKSRTFDSIAVPNIASGIGLGTEFRSEKIPRNRLGTVSVIPRMKVPIPRHSEFRGRANWNGTERNSAKKLSFTGL